MGTAACNKRELRIRDAELNATYRRVMRHLSAAARRDLRSKERRWIRRRDRICQEYAEMYAGPLAETNLSRYLIQETVMRTLWLERL